MGRIRPKLNKQLRARIVAESSAYVNFRFLSPKCYATIVFLATATASRFIDLHRFAYYYKKKDLE